MKFINKAIAGKYPYKDYRFGDEVIDWEVPAIVKNYKEEEKTDKKLYCSKSISHKTKSISEMSYNEVMWKIQKYLDEE